MLGLLDVVNSIFPYSLHRHYAQNLLHNFKAKHPLVVLRDYFWMAVITSNQFSFTKAMEKILAINNDAHDYLMDILTKKME